MKWFKGKGKEQPFCECENYCSCRQPPHHGCGDCDWYRFLDSGYGYCIAMPKVAVVPWCKITCSLFKARRVKNARTKQKAG